MSELSIGGVVVTELADTYGTPLYVYDESKIQDQMAQYLSAFKSNRFETRVLYASKAFQTVAMLNLVADAGLGCDAVSGGEIYTITQSRLPMEQVYFHGNNKTPDELQFAIEEGVVHIVVDNIMELELLNQLARRNDQQLEVMIRLNVGIEAHTHEYIVTSHVDSKFGVAFESEEYDHMMAVLGQSHHLKLEGFHVHIGSQIFDMTAWGQAINKLVSYLANFSQTLSLNLGGGFGIRYTDDDQPLAIPDVMHFLIERVEKALDHYGVELKQLLIEPGRSIVGEAGTTIYTVGYEKVTPNRHYYFVDGGMADNIRPALYQADYACDIANRIDAPKTETVTIAGKYCESGDILIQETQLPPRQPGDLLAIYSTGAYGFSMASQYNRAQRPAVVFVRNGTSRLVVARQTYEDLLRGEIY
jgi:diaminopimelate decarboxylase